MAIKKTELYTFLWKSCDELRGGMDASQYKDYVLTMLFLKYASDKSKNDKGSLIDIPKGASFEDFIALKGSKDIGDKMNVLIGMIAEKNELKGVIDLADFNNADKLGSGKEMQDRLSNLIGIFEDLSLADNVIDGDDLLGDAYEYLMRHFATESGKSKGQFYTPAEVSRILAKVVGIKPDMPCSTTVYDPTCGSGSLLLKASAESSKKGLSIYGQEMDNATAALAKMNMILHGHTKDVDSIHQGNTIAAPAFQSEHVLKTFDFVVANPPFSNKNWTSGINYNDKGEISDLYQRFEYGTPPTKNGDYAFLLHILKSLKSTGKGAVILPHGVLFRGNAEAIIRENLIKQGFIKGIIGLPANLFYGTSIPACIIVLDKEHAQTRAIHENQQYNDNHGIFMVDASKGFMKDGNKNRLRSQDIHKIVDAFTKEQEITGYSRKVSLTEIKANDFNLNMPRYIDSSEAEDLHDLKAHMFGGIPSRDINALQHYWHEFPSLRQTLFSKEVNGYSQALIAAPQVESTILAHPEFKAFAEKSLVPFTKWASEINLKEIVANDSPKALIYEISEKLLNSYENVPLLNKYDVYQILMDYWVDTMQDDMYIITQDGWESAKELKQILTEKGKKMTIIANMVIGKAKYRAELVEPTLIINRYFKAQQAQIDELQSEFDNATQALESYIEENTSDEGLLNDALNDKDKVSKKTAETRLKETTDVEEIKALKEAIKLFTAQTKAKKAVSDAELELAKVVFSKYPTLTEQEIKELLVQDKWLSVLKESIVAEIERVTQKLANRVKDLEERYSDPLPSIEENVNTLSDKVKAHLIIMGLELTL